jgi:very-short-patch-repair endonuclease
MIDLQKLAESFQQEIKQDDDKHTESITVLSDILSFYQKCESPIERILFWSFYKLLKLWPSNDGEVCDFLYMDELNNTETGSLDCVGFYVQYNESPYRIDFVIQSWDIRTKQILSFAVEVDGHDFHERTKEQTRRDKQRDRFLTSKNYMVLRFAGSEVYGNPDGVVSEIIGTIRSIGRGNG